MKSKHLKNKKDKPIKNKQNSLNKRKEKKNRRIVLNILSIVFLGLMIYSGIHIYLWWKDNQNSNSIMENISKTINDNDGKIDFDKLKKINDETIAYIKVKGTNIDYPVVKHTDNNFYINHSFDKTENSAGWIFADYRDSFDKTDRNLIIYGHNRRDGSMFSTLKNTLREEWYSNNDNLIIFLKTEEEDIKYQVFSTYQVKVEDYYTKTEFNNKTFEKFLKIIKDRSVNDYGVDVTNDDTILTLSTCGDNNKYRIVLHAKRVK